VAGLTDRHLALIAVLAGIMWAVGAIDLNAPAPERIGLLITGIAIAAWIALARGDAAAPVAGAPSMQGLVAGLYAVAVGGVERLQRDLLEGGSDVVRATREAIDVFLSGANPYDHVMLSTDPIGSPFVYPPGEFLFYVPAAVLFDDIGRVETWTGILTIAALVVAGARVGAGRAALIAMLYATWGIAAFRTTDGGNDVSAAFLVIVALVALAFAEAPGRSGRESAGSLPSEALRSMGRSRERGTGAPSPSVGAIAFVVSAVAFGWALAFKQFALLVWPVALRHLAVAGGDWRRYLAISGGVAAAFVLPFLLWSPGAFLGQQWQALTFHEEVWGANLPNTLRPFIDIEGALPLFFALELLATAALLTLALRLRIPTIGIAALLGAALLVVPLLLAKWTTQSYFVYAATIALAGIALIDVRADPRATGDRTAER
jgi:hypothetical protein